MTCRLIFMAIPWWWWWAATVTAPQPLLFMIFSLFLYSSFPSGFSFFHSFILPFFLSFFRSFTAFRVLQISMRWQKSVTAYFVSFYFIPGLFETSLSCCDGGPSSVIQILPKYSLWHEFNTVIDRKYFPFDLPLVEIQGKRKRWKKDVMMHINGSNGISGTKLSIQIQWIVVLANYSAYPWSYSSIE